MPTEPSAPICGRQLEAMQACATNPQGLRGNAYPSVMPVLEAQGLVTRRTSGRLGRTTYWFLTDAGRKLLAAQGALKADEP